MEYGYLATHSFAEGEIICSNMRYRGITIPLIIGLALGLDEEEPVGLASYSGDDISTPTQEVINGDDAGSGMPPWDDSLWLPLWCIYPDPAVINNVDRRLWCARPHPSNGKIAAHFYIFSQVCHSLLNQYNFNSHLQALCSSWELHSPLVKDVGFGYLEGVICLGLVTRSVEGCPKQRTC